MIIIALFFIFVYPVQNKGRLEGSRSPSPLSECNMLKTNTVASCAEERWFLGVNPGALLFFGNLAALKSISLEAICTGSHVSQILPESQRRCSEL